jgi:hypothetical protein
MCTSNLRGHAVYAVQIGKSRTKLSKKSATFGHVAPTTAQCFTVEHILPKTENLGPGWVTMLEGGRRELPMPFEDVALINSAT